MVGNFIRPSASPLFSVEALCVVDLHDLGLGRELPPHKLEIHNLTRPKRKADRAKKKQKKETENRQSDWTNSWACECTNATHLDRSSESQASAGLAGDMKLEC